jgi:cytochrome c-type biogenesis protein CcmF
MNLFGNGLIFVALTASVLSAIQYYRSAVSITQPVKNARLWLRISAAAIAVLSGLLLSLLVQHDFSNGYVYSYSSRDLPMHFLISSFYAGQEGSFLFWVLCSAMIGLALMHHTGKRKSEPWVMSVFMSVQTFLILLLYAKTPFLSVWEKIPQFPPGQLPADGNGLNPLLQNFWMVIHPPILFVGFAAMAVPFSYAVAGMWKKTYTLLSSQALGWLLFAVFILGTGIMLGGYWAYGVLGWGGYWGWDPVENSSLVPWLTGIALVHTLIVQRRTGKFLRTNLMLAIVSFLLVMYSTFLTRSGVLGDSSVHSFTDPGAGVYWLLIAFLTVIAVVGFGFMYIRRNELHPAKSDNQFVSKETALAAGTIALLLSAAVILFGTSLPLLGKSTVDVSFYDTMNLPLAIAMALFIGFSLYTQWGVDDWKGVLKRSLKWIGISVAAGVALYLLGVRDVGTFALVLTSTFAILVNIEFGWKQGRLDIAAIGGKLAHIGLGVFFLGVIASGKYSTTRQVSLLKGVPQDVLGHTLTYVGYEPTTDRKYAFNVNVVNEQTRFQLSPVMFDAGQQGTMKNPDIKSFLTSDFYISPISLEQSQEDHADHAGDVYTIEKGKTISIGGFRTTFVKFDMNAHSGNAMASGAASDMAVGSVLEVTDGKTKEIVTPMTVYGADGRQTSTPSESKLLNATIQLVSMNVGGMDGANASSVTVGVQRGQEAHAHQEALVVEASIKPFIGCVWVGTFLMFFGVIVAAMRRLREA